MSGNHDADEDRPRWRDADEDDDEPRDWEIEPEEEKDDRGGVLGSTRPVARVVFLGILLLVVVGGIAAAVRALRGHFG